MGSTRRSKFAKVLIGLGLFGPVVFAFSPFIFSLFGVRSWGATMYAPYMSVTTEDQPPVAIGLGFVIALVFANLLAIRGFRAFCEGRRKALPSLAVGLLFPVMLEVANLARSLVLFGGLSNAPRRYHYYYFAPEPNVIWSAIWDSFVPSSYWLVMTHVTSLVLLVLGHAILFDESRQVES